MYSKPLGASMNHGQSFIPGRLGRRNSAPGQAPSPAPAPPAVGGGIDQNSPALKQRGGQLAKPRRQRTPLQQAIYPQAV